MFQPQNFFFTPHHKTALTVTDTQQQPDIYNAAPEISETLHEFSTAVRIYQYFTNNGAIHAYSTSTITPHLSFGLTRMPPLFHTHQIIPQKLYNRSISVK